MPQLMPFMWVGSVYVSFMLLIMLVLMYNYIMSFYGFKLESVYVEIYNIKW